MPAPPIVKVAAQDARPTDERALTTRDGTDERVTRYMQMFREEWEKPFWQELRIQASQDFAYYTGAGQWTPEDKLRMERAQKPALTLNHIQPTCNLLFGLERTNRFDPQAKPEGEDDVDLANVFTRLLRRTMVDTDGEYVLSEGFQDGTICGVAAFELPIDYTEDPLYGDIRFRTVRVPDELIWATPWRQYDLSDVRAMFRHKWVDVDDLIALYPEKREAITEALSSVNKLTPQDATRDGSILSDGDPKDRYAGVDPRRPQDDLQFWFDIEHNRVRVLEVYYPDYYPTWILASGDGKRVVTSTDEPKIKRIYERLAETQMGQGYRLLQRNVRKIQMMVILPATGEILSEGTPFEKDTASYPYVAFFANFVRDDIYGVVRSLKDPQDEINARRSQIAWLTKATGDGWFVDRGSLEDPTKFQEESRDPKGTYIVKPQANDPRRIPPPNIPQGMFEILRVAVNEVRQISGVNSELLAAEENTASGVAIARRQHQGQVVTTTLFDNFRLTKRLIWRKMARRIQEVYTDARTIRLLNEDTGEDEFVKINDPVEEPGDSPDAATRMRVLNDITALKYDIVLRESPASPTARSAALATLLELIQKVPAAAPILLDEIVALTDGLHNRDTVIKRVKQLVAQMLAPKGPEPPKVAINLRGELDPMRAADLADGALDGKSGPEQNPLGAANGNPQNPSGQLPTGGAKLNERPDLPPTQ